MDFNIAISEIDEPHPLILHVFKAIALPMEVWESKCCSLPDTVIRRADSTPPLKSS